MKKEEKIPYFQYILHKLILWNNEVNRTTNNDITILKSLKLLFFISAAKTSIKENDLLDEVFDSFWAMPYGHVESDVYDEVKRLKGDLGLFELSSNNCISKISSDTDIKSLTSSLDLSKIKLIDDSIDTLKSYNRDIISYSAFELVELSHQWYSWRRNYRLAKEKGSHSQKIPSIDIKFESKIFKLTTF